MLKFGYNRGLPDGVDTAWGCRAIVNEDGSVDVPPDRIDAAGPRVKELEFHLQHHVGHAWRDRASGLLRRGRLDIRRSGEVILYQDHVVVIKGNTNGSAGYLYVCAYLRRPHAAQPSAELEGGDRSP